MADLRYGNGEKSTTVERKRTSRVRNETNVTENPYVMGWRDGGTTEKQKVIRT
jgi:hypothetical protein